MKTPRPKYTTPDANQKAAHAKLTEWGFLCVNVSNLPGNPTTNPLDAFVCSPGGVWLQVEWKTKPGNVAKFRDNQIEYLKLRGTWDFVLAGWQPVAVWRATESTTVVAWLPDQVAELFEVMREGDETTETLMDNRARLMAGRLADRSAQKLKSTLVHRG